MPAWAMETVGTPPFISERTQALAADSQEQDRSVLAGREADVTSDL